MSNHEQERLKPEESEKTKSQQQPASKEPSDSDHSGAQADDITLGDEAQKRREKLQRQEKAEGERR